MTADQPRADTTDPDDWRTFILANPRAKTTPPHTPDDCRAVVHAVWPQWFEHIGDEPAGLSAAQEIRLRLAEAILAADGIPIVDSQSAFIERVGHVVAGVALIVETGVPWPRRDPEYVDGVKVTKADILFPDGSHSYWSTHCRHGQHDKCAATEFAPGVERKPSQCKTCAAPCRCECHVKFTDPPYADGDTTGASG